MMLGVLSRRMMVTNGNVTSLADRLEGEGIIRRAASAADRRVVLVELTPQGRRMFSEVAEAHAAWIGELLQDLTGRQTREAMEALAAIKLSVRGAVDLAGRE